MTGAKARLELGRQETVTTIGIAGEIDVSNAVETRRRMFAHISNGDRAVIVDLSDLSFIDSAGIEILFALSDALAERRQPLIVVVPPGSQPRRTMEVVGLPTAVDMYPDRPSADLALST